MSTVTAVPLQPVKRGVLVYLWIGIALAIIAAIALAARGTAEQRAVKGSNEVFLAWNKKQPGVVETPSGLQYKVIKAGEGPMPTDADTAGITYVGHLRDGTVFDAQQQQPVPMQVNGVIPGFSEGLKLMNKGARYRFWIKPELGYKDAAAGPIAPNSLLIFDVDMAGFIPTAQFQQIQMQQMMQQQQRGGAGGSAGAGAPPGAGGPPPGR
ncbi:MAG: FKBP-type peptidyl-prolyl cis-trans isomerase [Pseudomonadota bacterium]|nr:FKBP-type peptidyl-prolyl cis-trans isomerase [Pseudomonadota bacterium]